MFACRWYRTCHSRANYGHLRLVSVMLITQIILCNSFIVCALFYKHGDVSELLNYECFDYVLD